MISRMDVDIFTFQSRRRNAISSTVARTHFYSCGILLLLLHSTTLEQALYWRCPFHFFTQTWRNDYNCSYSSTASRLVALFKSVWRAAYFPLNYKRRLILLRTHYAYSWSTHYACLFIYANLQACEANGSRAVQKENVWYSPKLSEFLTKKAKQYFLRSLHYFGNTIKQSLGILHVLFGCSNCTIADRKPCGRGNLEIFLLTSRET